MASSPIVKLQTYGARAVNKSASSILSHKKKPQKLSKQALQKLHEIDALKVRRCTICKISYQGSLVAHKLSQIHKKNKLADMLEIKR